MDASKRSASGAEPAMSAAEADVAAAVAILGNSADNAFSVSELALPPPQALSTEQRVAIKPEDSMAYGGLQAVAG
ncbi:hypothetical protein AT984_13585 [Paucibacter sp. KCTC 42545]|nr:hypothetical protein AT984_13585 [Paucibacter sp. KCTC 42545]